MYVLCAMWYRIYNVHRTLVHIFAQKSVQTSKSEFVLEPFTIGGGFYFLLLHPLHHLSDGISDDNWLNEHYFGYKWTIPAKCSWSKMRRKIWISLKKSQIEYIGWWYLLKAFVHFKWWISNILPLEVRTNSYTHLSMPFSHRISPYSIFLKISFYLGQVTQHKTFAIHMGTGEQPFLFLFLFVLSHDLLVVFPYRLILYFFRFCHVFISYI